MTQKPLPVILVFPFGLLSHYLRCIVLARMFKPYFTLKFAYHKQYNSFVESEGFESFPCKSMDEAQVIQCIKNFDFSWISELSLEPVFLSQIAAIEEHQPIAILGDAVPTLKMAAEYTEVYHLTLLNGYMSKYYDGVRNLPRTHPAFPYLTKLPVSFQQFLTQHGESLAFRKIHQPFKKMRTKYHLPQHNTYLDEMEGDQTLICDLFSIFPQKEQPAEYVEIGPLIYEGYHSADEKSFRTLNLTKKTIYVSMGSTGEWEQMTFLNHNFYNRFNIVTSGDSKAYLDAPHIIRNDFVSAAEIFPHTDLVICHGGNGTLYQALSYGVPLLCKSFHFEQEWNVNVLEKLGVAKSLDNVKDDQQYEALISEWIGRKHIDAQGKIRDAIAVAVANGPKVVKKVAEILAQSIKSPQDVSMKVNQSALPYSYTNH